MSLPKLRLERCLPLCPAGSASPKLWRLGEEGTRHLTKSLRLYEGAMVEGLLNEPNEDGAGAAGRKFLLRLERDEEGYLLREVGSEAVPPDEMSLTLVIGLLKADQFEAVLRASAEIGVAEIRPLICERSVPRIESKELERKMIRWRRIVDEGTQVSGAIVPPTLMTPVAFSRCDWASLPLRRYVAMLATDALPLREIVTSGRGGIVFAVGPEGDWSDKEAESLRGSGFTPVGMGSRILRASTAALVGCGWFRLSYGS